MMHFCIVIFTSGILSLSRAESCRHLMSCESCMEGMPALNITCKWITCGTSENNSCVTGGEIMAESCIVLNTSSHCEVTNNTSTELLHEGFLSPYINTPVSIPDTPATNTLSTPVFHTGSFIGGAVLVILLQGIGYFVIKHLHGPGGDYQTMEETAQ